MALVNQPAILSGAFAAEGDKNTIPANNDGLSGLASIAKGFPPITQVPLAQGGLPPQRQDFNGIFNLISKYLLYAQVGGVYEYNNTLDYQPPCIISYNDKFYACKEANGPSTSAGIQSPTVNDYWDEVIIEVATEAEAEAQSAQNNSKIMTPLRVYQAIVAYFTQFLAAAVFTGIIKAVAPAAASNDNSVPTTSWVRTCFESMAKTVAEILEIQWKAEATGYLLLGPYLGNLKILWGETVTTPADNGGKIIFTPAVQCNSILNAILSDTTGRVAMGQTIEGGRITNISNGKIQAQSDWEQGVEQTFRYVAFAI